MPPLPIRVPYTMIMFNRSWLKKKIKRERGGEGEGKRREQTDRREKKKKEGKDWKRKRRQFYIEESTRCRWDYLQSLDQYLRLEEDLLEYTILRWCNYS